MKLIHSIGKDTEVVSSPVAIQKTEEWAGSETRSYENYIRPIGNLFENDNALYNLSKKDAEALFKGEDNCVISGCLAVTSEGTNFTELKPGTFLFNNTVYNVYPNCQYASKYVSGLQGHANTTFTYDQTTGNYYYYVNGAQSQSSYQSIYAMLVTALGLAAQQAIESRLMPAVLGGDIYYTSSGFAASSSETSDLHFTSTDSSYSGIKAKITNAINALDVAGVGGDDKYISTISEADGKISAKAEALVSDISLSPSAAAAPKTSAVKNYVDTRISESVGELLGEQCIAVHNNSSALKVGKNQSVAKVDTEGNISCLSLNTTSSRKFKEDIIPADDVNALDIINDTDVVKFKYINIDTPKIGFIAEDTHELLASPKHDRMDISNCIGLLLKAVQELDAKNKELEERIKVLEAK